MTLALNLTEKRQKIQKAQKGKKKTGRKCRLV